MILKWLDAALRRGAALLRPSLARFPPLAAARHLTFRVAPAISFILGLEGPARGKVRLSSAIRSLGLTKTGDLQRIE